MKQLALFDFDGTLTVKDTLLAFIRFYKGNFRFYVGMIVLAPMLVLYKLKIIPNWKAKEYVLAFFFKGEDVVLFNRKAKEFSLREIPRLLNDIALKKLHWHKSQGDRVAVVTASAVNWVKPWSDEAGVGLVATKLEEKHGRLTGKISGKNCYGPEKVKRLCENINTGEFTSIYAYGDSRGDKELLEMATHPFFRRF